MVILKVNTFDTTTFKEITKVFTNMANLLIYLLFPASFMLILNFI